MSNLKLKIALDTQILAYLIDKTYPSLNIFIEILANCEFVELICSRFVTFEFIGIRKQEHYLRAIHQHSNDKGGNMNFSSTLKYKNDWSSPELPYQNAFIKIKDIVEEDLRKINDDFGIEYEEMQIQDSLWKPLQDLILSSKISKEDSLVLLSSILPDEKDEKHLIFLTNDNQFYKSFCGKNLNDRMESIDEVFSKYELTIPTTNKIDLIDINGRTFSLLESNKTAKIKLFSTFFVLENIKNKYFQIYLGKVVPCSKSMFGKLLCFELNSNLPSKNIYITILSNRLDFIHSFESSLDNFHNVNIGEIQNYPYEPDENTTNSKIVSTFLKDKEGNLLDEGLYSKLTANGNLIFLHPDSDI